MCIQLYLWLQVNENNDNVDNITMFYAKKY